MRRVALLCTLIACSRSELDVPNDDAEVEASARDVIDAAAADVDPLEQCSGSRDVLYFDLIGSGIGYLAQTVRVTNLDATWTMIGFSDVDLYISTGGADYWFEVLTSGTSHLTPGTYDDDSTNGPWPSLAMNGIACSIGNGKLHIDAVAYPDGGNQVSSVLLWFDGQCSQDFKIHGCVRYEVSP